VTPPSSSRRGDAPDPQRRAGDARPGRGARRARGTGRAAAPRPAARGLRKVEETSAGGLVVDRNGGRPKAAIIGRRDRRGRLLWSLPKGHLESGETAEDAAVREVEEETGIRGRVMAPLGTIDYWFVAENRRIHKTVHHYLLEASGGELSDDDVEVDEVAWVPVEELGNRLAYAGERRLAETAAGLLADSA
jgi:8-oxo-dGTP pyrophosphatase MutT (NUDIX family)